MLPLYDHIHIRYVNTLVISTAYLRHVLIHLNYHDVRLPGNRGSHTGIHREVKITMLVHRSHRHHDHIYMEEILIVCRIIVEHHRYIIAFALIAQLSLVLRTVPAVIHKMLLTVIALCNLYRPSHQIASDLHIVQLISPLCQCSVK